MVPAKSGPFGAETGPKGYFFSNAKNLSS